jgi:Trypsin-co-occurring domain 1
LPIFGDGSVVNFERFAGGKMAEILVEVRPKNSRTAGELSPKPAIPEPLEKRLTELCEALKKLAVQIGDGLDELSAQNEKSFQVDEIEIKVNIDLESEAGVIIARAKASAGFEASIKWKRQKSA